MRLRAALALIGALAPWWAGTLVQPTNVEVARSVSLTSAQRPTTTSTTTTSTPTTSTTTTTAITTTTTVVPDPEPVTRQPEPAPLPEDPPVPASADPGTADPHARVTAALNDTVPARWHHVLEYFEFVPGSTSWAWDVPAKVQISSYHANGTWERLREIVAHEIGHLIAFRYGTDEYHGAPPAGIPLAAGSEETWAECVAEVWAGPSPRVHCPAHASGPTRAWLASNP